MSDRPQKLAELTLRGLVLGALITIVFTAANVYLGLKVGLTFSSSIPAAVISMAVLRLLGGGSILENNMVQTQASAAGTLSSVIFILPALIMVGQWRGFPFWQSALVCAAGGVLGVVFTIPLRRAMVVGSDLPYPEGVAAAEILRAGAATGADRLAGEPGADDILAGGLVSAAVSFATSGLHVLSDGIDGWFAAGASVFRVSTGFSLALLGAGYLVGITVGLAMLLGAVLSWGIAVPVLTALAPMPAGGDMIAYATGIWAHKVRFMGAGTIGIAAIWALIGLAGPTIDGVRASLGRVSLAGGPRPRTDQDLPPRWIGLLFALSLLGMAAAFIAFFSGLAPVAAVGIGGFVAYGLIFALVFGFLIAAACGFMAGLIGSSASPISGIGILATILASLLLLAFLSAGGVLLGDAAGENAAIAVVLFIVAFVLATATISNDNLQDLKTGQLVGATPWRQQVALVVGCLVGAAVIPPILNVLYHAYGFAGAAMPAPGMNADAALAAPQATLMAAIATGIFRHKLDWTMVLIGIAAGIAMILVDTVLKRRGGTARLPALAAGIGIYLPPSVGVTLALGAVLGWWIDRRLGARADGERVRRRGVLLASGLIVGESLVGVVLAGVIGLSGSQAPLALVGAGFAPAASWLGLVVFGLVAAMFARRTLA